MPFKWPKKTNRVPASPERMKKAVQEVVSGCPLRTTATKYNVDKMTLRRYVAKYKDQGDDTTFVPNFACSQIFNVEEEKRLAEYLLTAAKMNYGFTSKETRKFAYLYATENKKKIPQNWTANKIASYEWLRGFMNRNKTLSLRRPEATSLARGTAFNRHTVGEFYNLLSEVSSREHFGAESIYNCDETGVQTVHKPGKILSQKGQKQVSKTTSGERGQTVTVLCTISAKQSPFRKSWPLYKVLHVHFKPATYEEADKQLKMLLCETSEGTSADSNQQALIQKPPINSCNSDSSESDDEFVRKKLCNRNVDNSTRETPKVIS